MDSWGFSIAKTRTIDIDSVDFKVLARLTDKVPSAKRCIMCGACAATCSAANFVDFSFRKTHLLFHRGQFSNISEELDKCMLCGKCKLVCLRGVNTRAIIYNLRIILNDMNYKRIAL